jgi:ribonuclease D
MTDAYQTEPWTPYTLAYETPSVATTATTDKTKTEQASKRDTNRQRIVSQNQIITTVAHLPMKIKTKGKTQARYQPTSDNHQKKNNQQHPGLTTNKTINRLHRQSKTQPRLHKAVDNQIMRHFLPTYIKCAPNS